ncbi:bifunctional phosphopantothenoylcysteine decarboxylase/phosphopantothenate--cysteine ligase CoaBC [Olsenella uli]|uniref:bifunctional phosphopantothenoylcysteine decarboxylase/phosphopantothenate--cysteine ligase CoaBC n=1 Tax=Olsenella uli TaxID=133926 RepID=UPI0028E48EF6|nr:bifunctional phosphopantothenoylcysteine decarboxylase/phosphopantothenate--cysteine ligase CoaBC [Olsenella uli]
MSGRNVALAVCGGIAAYKACEVLRGLQRGGCDVRVAMTADAERFVGATTFEALSHHEVVNDLYACHETAIPHIALADFADLCVVVPATANVLAKMAAGIADDALTSALLAMRCPLLVAPAMNVHMWHNPATQANVELLRSRGISFVGPREGHLACGYEGEGKLASANEVVSASLARLDARAQDLAGIRVLVTAGPTHEAIDAVRYIANSSTGKMGLAITREALARGAQVTLVCGPVAERMPEGAQVVPVISAAQMHAAAERAFAEADVAICAAAVADYTPAHPSTHKLKKDRSPLDAIELVETADILKSLSAEKGSRVVVGFAAETDDLIGNARSKLSRKGCDLIVANDVSRPDSTFGSDTDRVAFVWPDRTEQLETLPLDEVARELLDRVRDLAGA